MIVSGNAITGAIKEELRKTITACDRKPALALIACGDNPVSARFMRAKEVFGRSLGVPVRTVRIPEPSSTGEIITAITESARDPGVRGIVIQLPLPKHIPSDEVFSAIPSYLDIDVLSREAFEAFSSGGSAMIPPVAAAVREICERYGVDVRGKNAVVVGKGKLVGLPVSVLLARNGARVTMADRSTGDLAAILFRADIIVTGAGKPGLITPEMVREGAVLIDAATSEENGVIAGDADPRCAEKCSLFSPVPGGVGPVTVAMLFKNLVSPPS